MFYHTLWQKIKNFYFLIQGPFLFLLFFVFLYFYYKNLLAFFFEPNGIILTIIDIFLIVSIFISSLTLLLRIINTALVRIHDYAKEHKAQTFLFLLPILENGIKVIIFLWLLYFFTPYFNLPDKYSLVFAKAIDILTIVVIAFVFIRAIIHYEKIILNYYTQDMASSIKARQIYTQTHIFRQIMISVVVVFAAAAIFMLFENVKQIGLSILASAGVLSAIIVFSAQKSLSNIMACLQLAITRILRIGDEVIIDGETGKIEEITLSYIIVKIWDLRRLIIPIHYLNEKPFQNLTRSSSQLLGSIFIYVDYHFPVESARSAFQEIVEASTYWDKEVAKLHVSNCDSHCMEIRLLVSAANASILWELRCEVREKMIAYLAKEHSEHLPMMRAKINALEDKFSASSAVD